MANAVIAGTLAAVKELETPPPAKGISSISAAAGEDAVVGLFVLGSARCGDFLVWLRLVRRYVDRHRRPSSGYFVWFPLPGSSPVCLRVV